MYILEARQETLEDDDEVEEGLVEWDSCLEFDEPGAKCLTKELIQAVRKNGFLSLLTPHSDEGL